MRKTKIDSHVRNGKLIQNRELLSKALSGFEGKNITITVERKKEKRSIDANAYYWGVVVKMIKMAIEEQTGDIVTPDDVHDLLKGQFNNTTITQKTTKDMVRFGKSTANLTPWGFKSYYGRCRYWANDFFDIEIPEPNEEMTGKIDEDFEKDENKLNK